MNRERGWELLARKLSNEASEAELRELQDLLRHFPELNYAGELLVSVRQVNKKKKEEADIDAFMEKVSAEPVMTAGTKRNIRPLVLKWLAAAVLTGLVLTAGLLVLRNGNGGKGRHNEIVTRNGSRTSIELPDGSTVRLNGGSRLTYEDGFGKKDRVVTLEGEAFFDVKADPAHPFIVNTSALTIRVLGTAFNVNTYDEAVETVLIRGKVEVQLKDQAESRIVLKPLEKLKVTGGSGDNPIDSAVHDKKDIKYQVSAVHRNEEIDDFSETAWLNNKLVFKDESFESLKSRMERWYNVHIVIADEGLKQEELTGVFQNENIVQALNALQVITSFRYYQKSDSIFIQPK